MNLAHKILKLRGFPIDLANKKLKEIQILCKNDLASYQHEMKWKIFNFHIKNNSPYYKFIGSKQINRWLDIPILTKKDIQLPIEKRLSKGYTINNSHIHNTSGSTGLPFYFAKDKFSHALSWALIFDRYGRHNIINGKDLQARFYGIPLDSKKYLLEKIKDFIFSRIRFPVFDLSDKKLAYYINVFKRKKFIYINGYTSSLVLMAKFCIKNRITLKNLCPTLLATFPTSEVCDKIDREILEKGFGIPVFNEYGAAELDLIGFEDNKQNMLLTNETILVEILDNNNNPVDNGKEGRVVVTSFFNKAMPFIRYELGDKAILKNTKKDSYNIIDNVTGRINDFAILPSGKKSAGLTFYYISKKILESGGFLKEFIIKQNSINSFHYEYVADRQLNESEKNKIKEAMNVYLEKGLNITFERKKKIQRTGSGKLKHFFSNFKHK